MQPCHCIQCCFKVEEKSRGQRDTLVAGNLGHTTEHSAVGILERRVLYLNKAAGACWLNRRRTTNLNTATKQLPRKRDLPGAWEAVQPGRTLHWQEPDCRRELASDSHGCLHPNRWKCIIQSVTVCHVVIGT